MFAKKQPFQLQMNSLNPMRLPFTQNDFNAKHLNHDFFLLVRDQKYQEAYPLGQIILKSDPHNSAVGKFCEFIKNNYKDLSKMVQQQNDYTDGSEDQKDQQYSDQQDQESSEQNSEQEKQTSSVHSSSRSISSKNSLKNPKQISRKSIPSQKAVGKSSVNKENVYKWEHNCKNPNCPNKNKPHRH